MAHDVEFVRCGTVASIRNKTLLIIVYRVRHHELILLLGALDVLYMQLVRSRYLYSCLSHLFMLFRSR